MIKQQIIAPSLLEFKYYKNKLPMYLRQSQSFQEHFKIWYDILINNVDNSFVMLNLLNIFSTDYFDFMLESCSVSKTGHQCDVLDKLGDLFGVSRYVNVTYTYESQTHSESLLLDNETFLIYIKSRIVRNYCEGTVKQMAQFYKDLNENIFVSTSHDDNATAVLYLISYDTLSELNNVQKLFLAGELNISSMGVSYTNTIYVKDHTLLWDISDEQLTANNSWDGGYWL